jgi:hypothetical protein
MKANIATESISATRVANGQFSVDEVLTTDFIAVQHQRLETDLHGRGVVFLPRRLASRSGFSF